MKNFFYIIFILIFPIFLLLNIYKEKEDCGFYGTQEIYLNNKKFLFEISDNDCKRILGLSGREKISQDRGMLFLFEREEGNGIWMKDMKFPIDIVWLDKDEKIVFFEKNVLPESFPLVFGDKIASKFVLEIPSGTIDYLQIKLGDKVSILKD